MKRIIFVWSMLGAAACGPAIPSPQDDALDEARDEACSEYCEAEVRCDYRSHSECFDACILGRALSTEH